MGYWSEVCRPALLEIVTTFDVTLHNFVQLYWTDIENIKISNEYRTNISLCENQIRKESQKIRIGIHSHKLAFIIPQNRKMNVTVPTDATFPSAENKIKHHILSARDITLFEKKRVELYEQISYLQKILTHQISCNGTGPSGPQFWLDSQLVAPDEDSSWFAFEEVNWPLFLCILNIRIMEIRKYYN